jgi:copper(I)-binding protein
MLAAATLLPLAVLAAGVAQDCGTTVDHAWARETPRAARTSAAYVRIESPIDDRLIGLASPISRKAELRTQVEQNGIMEMARGRGASIAGRPAGRTGAGRRI